MKIKKSTRLYEEWLGEHLSIVKSDLDQKHKNMASDPFIFLRATFYRWAQKWPEVCADLATAPKVLAVGDLHIENFGTWRDSEGRLIWGINDFDEVYPLPYTNDLVRLATSAYLAAESERLSISLKEACAALLSGYAQGLVSGGQPFVLEESHPELRKMAYGELRDPVPFWKKMQAHPRPRGPVPEEAVSMLEGALPVGCSKYRIVTRQAGQGSLGHQRFIALAEYSGGLVARETKAMRPSACVWAEGAKSKKILLEDLIGTAVRCQDPFLRVKGDWLVRRLAPHCSRIELASLPRVRDEKVLLEAMGRETANNHLASRKAVKDVLHDLRTRPSGWLCQATKEMARCIDKDWTAWREFMDDQDT